MDLALTIGTEQGWLAEYQTLVAALVALVGAFFGGWTILRQSRVQDAASKELIKVQKEQLDQTWKRELTRQAENEYKQKTALATLFLEDLSQLKQDSVKFSEVLENASELGLKGESLRAVVESNKNFITYFSISLSWTELSYLDLMDIRFAQHVKRCHSAIVADIDHLVSVTKSSLDLFQPLNFDFQRAALTGLFERLDSLQSDLDFVVDNVSRRYGLESGTIRGWLDEQETAEPGELRLGQTPSGTAKVGL